MTPEELVEWQHAVDLAHELLSRSRSFHLFAVREEDGVIEAMYPYRIGTNDDDKLRVTLQAFVDKKNEEDPLDAERLRALGA